MCTSHACSVKRTSSIASRVLRNTIPRWTMASLAGMPRLAQRCPLVIQMKPARIWNPREVSLRSFATAGLPWRGPAVKKGLVGGAGAGLRRRYDSFLYIHVDKMTHGTGLMLSAGTSTSYRASLSPLRRASATSLLPIPPPPNHQKKKTPPQRTSPPSSPPTG